VKSIKKHIRVFPDFSSSGIWGYPGGGMIEYEDLGISLELQKEFEDWIRFYDFECTAKKTFLVLKKKEKVLNRRGIELATKLKKELPKKIIYYWPEWSKGKMAELQEIK
jgi:hypothetical protein